MDVQSLGDHDEAVDAASVLVAPDAGQHGVGHRVAAHDHAVGELAL
ncbi:hypothetical protein AB5J49_38700 [Streptomyces sp. R28]|uniref:Uncharacterized protein n=1 Tax=Streptomyces sp. R28 TaxID=3238628 RepID=A0AB39Q803_9ACTN